LYSRCITPRRSRKLSLNPLADNSGSAMAQTSLKSPGKEYTYRTVLYADPAESRSIWVVMRLPSRKSNDIACRKSIAGTTTKPTSITTAIRIVRSLLFASLFMTFPTSSSYCAPTRESRKTSSRRSKMLHDTSDHTAGSILSCILLVMSSEVEISGLGPDVVQVCSQIPPHRPG